MTKIRYKINPHIIRGPKKWGFGIGIRYNSLTYLKLLSFYIHFLFWVIKVNFKKLIFKENEDDKN